jgi:hypothetical protein
MGSSFSMDGGGMSPEDTCAICTESGADQDTGVEQVQICPNGHYAHVDCITPWYAQADKCPECRVDVQNFPLWREINPIGPEPVLPYNPLFHNDVAVYDFSDPEQVRNAVRRYTDMKEQNDYDIALEYFYTPEGDAFIRYLIDEEMGQYGYLVNEQDEDRDNVDIDSLMWEILEENRMNVAEALYTYAQRNDFLDDLIESSGAIINKYVDNFHFARNQTIINWLWSRGFGAGFGFLDDAVFNNINVNAVQWYLTNVVPDIGDQRLIDIFNNLEPLPSSMVTDEQNDIYNLLDTYIKNNTQVHQGGQSGGMWQRGGFFMTCS